MSAADTSPRAWPRRSALALVWLALVVMGGIFVHSAEADHHASLERLFGARAETRAQLVQAYAQDVFQHNEAFATSVLQDQVQPADFQRLMVANGIEAAFVLDGTGRVLAADPMSPTILGSRLGHQYAHLRGALAGVPTASNVVPSVVRKVPIIAFAVPFQTPNGRRVFSAAYEVAETPLESFVGNNIGRVPEAIYLIDAAGFIVSSGGSKAVEADRLVDVDPAMAAAAEQQGSQSVTVDGQPWRLVTMPVTGTPWRIMFAIPTDVLYASISQVDLWATRLSLLAISLIGMVVVVLVERTARQRAKVVEQQRLAAAAAHDTRDEAVAANAAKSAFLATMSHEIRTPMNAVIGMTGLLVDTHLDPHQRELVETVRSSGDALLALINDILDYSKIEAGQLDLERRPFHLTETVESCLDLVAMKADAKGLALYCDVDASCPAVVVGDQTRLRQVLVNLLSNAVKFTAAGDVLVMVCASPDAGTDEPRLTFAVTDSGIGIPSDRMHRLFHSFSQVDDSTTRRYGGTGLGLAISQRLVAAMGGELAVTSTLDVGSTFSFTLSLPRPVQDAQGMPADPDITGLAAKTVLIVDDNPRMRRILDAQLSAYSMVCTAVGTGAGALELIRGGTAYDLAVIDIQLPDMSGLDVAASARQVLTASSLPLVLLTPLRGTPDSERPLRAEFVTKPVKQSALRAALINLLGPPAPDPATSVPVSAPAPSHPAHHPQTRPLRLLLVEDNRVNQRVGQLMLGKLGHQVDVVADGEQALDAAHQVRYDLILMDVQMPVMDGLEATRRIRRELPAGSQPYIVALTASALLDDQDACLAAGMDDYLPKPVRESELRAAVDRVTATVGRGTY